MSEGFDLRLRRSLDAEAASRRHRLLGHRLPALGLPALSLGLAAALVAAVLLAPRRRDAPIRHDAASPVERLVSAQEWSALECRVGGSGRCRIDAPCATAETCGAARIAGWKNVSTRRLVEGQY